MELFHTCMLCWLVGCGDESQGEPNDNNWIPCLSHSKHSDAGLGIGQQEIFWGQDDKLLWT
jgi:hypothetical protein